MTYAEAPSRKRLQAVEISCCGITDFKDIIKRDIWNQLGSYYDKKTKKVIIGCTFGDNHHFPHDGVPDIAGNNSKSQFLPTHAPPFVTVSMVEDGIMKFTFPDENWFGERGNYSETETEEIKKLQGALLQSLHEKISPQYIQEIWQ